MKINGYQQKSSPDFDKLLLGAHFSIAGGYHKAVEEAVSLGCPVFQIFTKNASTWREREISRTEADLFRRACQRAGIHSVAAHGSYLINLASPDNVKWNRSCRALHREIERASRLGIGSLVLHPGNHMGAGLESGIKRIVAALDTALELADRFGVWLLLETTAGQGTGIGCRFEQLAQIMIALGDPDRVGVCLDTCHVFAAGYDLRTKRALQETLKTFDRLIGLERLKLLHFNDSLKPLGSRIDRHVHIGQGQIGEEGFTCLMQHSLLAKLPKIIETPKKAGGRDCDRRNLEKLQAMALAAGCC